MERRVLFVRPGPIGNALAAVPALRALRKAWPQARVTVLVEGAGMEALKGCPYVDDFFLYEKRGRHKGLAGWLKTVIELRRLKFTHVILSKRFFRMSFIADLTGAPVRVGFAEYGYKLTEAVTWQPDRQVIDTNLDLTFALGIPPAGRELEIWPGEEDVRDAEEFLKKNDLDGRPFKAAIHAGGITQRQRSWPLKKYAELAVTLARQYDAAPIFIGGQADAEAVKEMHSLTENKFVDSIGLNLRATAHLISKCRLFIGADSGPSHLAQAVGTPGVIYYGPQDDRQTNLNRWKPEGDMYIAAGPEQDGSHPDVRVMLGHVSELIHRMEEAKRRQS